MRDTAAIADSGPLICLAKIDQLELLPRLFSKILVPPEVWNEVTVRGQGHPGAHEVSQVTWLTIQTPDPQLVKPLSILVDAGEAEAIGLLLRAKRRELVKNIRPHIDALVENGIYIRKELIDAVLKDAGE